MNRTFGSSLVLRMCVLILLSLGLFAYGGYRLVVEPAINELALSQMSNVAQKVQVRLESSFSGVETNLQSSRTWAENTQARPNAEFLTRFTQAIITVIAHRTETSAVMQDYGLAHLEHAGPGAHAGRAANRLRRPFAPLVQRRHGADLIRRHVLDRPLYLLHQLGAGRQGVSPGWLLSRRLTNSCPLAQGQSAYCLQWPSYHWAWELGDTRKAHGNAEPNHPLYWTKPTQSATPTTTRICTSACCANSENAKLNSSSRAAPRTE